MKEGKIIKVLILFIPDHLSVLNLGKERLKVALHKAIGSDKLVKEG